MNVCDVDEVDERVLIEACRAGSVEAFGVLVGRCQDRLYPTILRLTGSPEDALDVMQDAFLRAFEKFDSFQGDCRLGTWLYRIAVNLAISRKRRRREFLRLDVEFSDEGAIADRSAADPSAWTLDREREAQVLQALDGLSAEHRAVVVLKEYDDLSYEEIGRMLNIPVGTVRSRLHRARLELRELLSALADDDVRVMDAADSTRRARQVDKSS